MRETRYCPFKRETNSSILIAVTSEQLILSKNLKAFRRVSGREINRRKPRARPNHSCSISLPAFESQLVSYCVTLRQLLQTGNSFP
jgi:hypothetical protein